MKRQKLRKILLVILIILIIIILFMFIFKKEDNKFNIKLSGNKENSVDSLPNVNINK